jgi:BTB/POZ domain
MGMHSRVFRSMLFNGMKESSQTEIQLVDVEKETFLHLLGCISSHYSLVSRSAFYHLDIYCGTVPQDTSLSFLVSLLAASDKV